MDDLYNCFWCDAINRATQNRWCLCGGPDATLVCDKCRKCFCTAPDRWKKEFREKLDPVLADVRNEPAHDRPIILIIDDDRVIHSMAARALTEFKGTLLHAYDGSEGLRMAREVRPDIILTDCLMPLMDGREIAKILKSEPATCDIRVFAMTSLYRGAKYRHEALTNFRADGFIEKPISAAKLREIAAGAR
jgi:CheY-like chemotaxis protein